MSKYTCYVHFDEENSIHSLMELVYFLRLIFLNGEGHTVDIRAEKHFECIQKRDRSSPISEKCYDNHISTMQTLRLRYLPNRILL